MPLAIDWYNQIIEITSPTTSLAGQVLHDFIEDVMASPVGLLYSAIIQPEGKIEDPSNPGIYSQIIMILNSPWQIQFWGGSGYTRIYGAKIVGGLADEPIKATGMAGDITVLESPVDGVTVVSGSGITQQDKDDIIDGVLDDPMHQHIVDGSLSHGMKYRTFNNRVCIDPINGNPGTTYPLGISSHPVSNLADAKNIADEYNIREMQLFNHLVIGAGDNINDYIFHAEQDIDVVITMIAGCTTQNTRFHHLILQGTFNGKSYIDHSTTLEIFNYSGFIIDSVFMDNIGVVNPSVPSLFSLCGGGKVSPPVEIDLGDSSLNVGGWKASMKLVNKTGSGTTLIELLSGQVIIDSTCVSGDIVLKGIGRLVEDNSGPGCTVCTKDLVNRYVIADQTWDEADQEHVIPGSMGGNLNAIKGMESGRWKIDKITKQMTFYKEDNVTEITKFRLLDSAGIPSYEDVFERVKITTTTTTSTTTTTTSSTSTTTTTTV